LFQPPTPSPLTRKEYYHIFSSVATILLIMNIGTNMFFRAGYEVTVEQLSMAMLAFMLLFGYGAFMNYTNQYKKD
jgi:hypothetical protein